MPLTTSWSSPLTMIWQTAEASQISFPSQNLSNQRFRTDVLPENYTLKKPVFFAAATRDAACTPSYGKELTARFCTNATVQDFDSGYWSNVEAADTMNPAIERWISSIVGCSPVAVK